METKELDTKRLMLRPIREDDVETVFQCWMQDEAVSRYMWWKASDDRKEAEGFVNFELENRKSDLWYRWLIDLKSTGETIGTCLVFYNDDEGENHWDISYNLGVKFWGKGYITEAMERVMIFAKEELRIKECITTYAKENPSSGKVLTKLGFEFVQEEPYFCNGGGIETTGIRVAWKDSRPKELSEMTLEELWELFPIVLVEHSEEWNQQYNDMAKYLKGKLESYDVVGISHIGSTAINHIWAKPIVDILVELAPGENMGDVCEAIINCGFIKMSESPKRVSFNWGYTPNGFAKKVYHLHLRFAGDNNELYFRDYLNEHSSVAKEYERLKLDLWHQYEQDRDGYTEAKTEFVDQYTKTAKKQYGNRY